MKRLPLVLVLMQSAVVSSRAADTSDLSVDADDPWADEDAGIPEGAPAVLERCIGCHGSNGMSPNPDWPNLTGQAARYTEKQIKDYASGRRPDPFMAGVAAGLKPAEIEALAKWFAAVPYAERTLPAPTEEEQALLDLGKALYETGAIKRGILACGRCHADDTRGVESRYAARLDRQPRDYTIRQLKMFRAKSRTNDVDGLMPATAEALTDQEIAACAEYIFRM